jgi:hypothetical protein
LFAISRQTAKSVVSHLTGLTAIRCRPRALPSTWPGGPTVNVFVVRCASADGKVAHYRDFQCRKLGRQPADGKAVCRPWAGPLPSAMADGKVADSCSAITKHLSHYKINQSSWPNQTDRPERNRKL